ncbi:MAG: LytTR family DNA-binding domain-containing protein [Lentilactobacillus diolivorans]
MMNVIVLEDDLDRLDYLTGFVKRYSQFERLPVKVALATEKFDEVKEYVERNRGKDALFFLDIILTGEVRDGIDLAIFIRRRMPNAQIVFVTKHRELVMPAVTHNTLPMDFIPKDVGPRQFEQTIRQDIKLALRKITTSKPTQSETFVYHVNEKYYEIPIDDVVLIESVPKKANQLILYTNKTIIPIYGQLIDFERKFKILYRCHRSYLVNPNNVRRVFGKPPLVLLNRVGKNTCPVSERHIRELHQIVDKID